MNTREASRYGIIVEDCTRTGRSAFTIVELLVVVGLIVVIWMVVFNIFRGASRSQVKTAEDLQMQSRMLGMQNELLRIIRDGKAFIIPRLGESLPTLCFIDKVSDIQALVPVPDQRLSAKTGKTLYKLMHYKVEMENFDLDTPPLASGSFVGDYIESITFRPSNANSVNVSILFSNETRQFQIMFEGGLMNAGDVE